MARGKGRQLVEGAYRHRECDACLKPRPDKVYLDTKTRWITRQRFCEGRLVDFALVLQRKRPHGWRDVTRYSVAHANFHQYVFSFRDRTRSKCEIFGCIDRPEQIREAYQAAVQNGLGQTEKWLSLWRRAL